MKILYFRQNMNLRLSFSVWYKTTIMICVRLYSSAIFCMMVIFHGIQVNYCTNWMKHCKTAIVNQLTMLLGLITKNWYLCEVGPLFPFCHDCCLVSALWPPTLCKWDPNFLCIMTSDTWVTPADSSIDIHLTLIRKTILCHGTRIYYNVITWVMGVNAVL